MLIIGSHFASLKRAHFSGLVLVAGLAVFPTLLPAQGLRIDGDGEAISYSQDPVAQEVALASFILHDVEFIVRTWKAPDSDRAELLNWIETTEARLDKLELIAGEPGVDGRVVTSVRLCKDMVEEYSELARELGLVSLIGETTRHDPDAAWDGGGGRFAEGAINGAQLGGSLGAAFGPGGALIGGTVMAIAGAGYEGHSMWDESRSTSFLNATNASLTNAHAANRVEEARRKFNLKMESLKELSSYLSKAYPVRFPSFEASEDLSTYVSRNKWNPFGNLMEATRASHHDRLLAARLFAEAAARVPSGTKYDHTIMSPYYRIPYLLVAGHLAEFEHRTGASEGAARQALLYYGEALRHARGDLYAIPFPYLVSMGRSAVAAGEPDLGRRVLEHASSSLPSDLDARASQAYDLACLASLLGDFRASYSLLAESYRARPRRDPYALQDPDLSDLRAAHPSTVRLLAYHPLVGGVWTMTSDSSYTYQFYPDGGLFQMRGGKQVYGNWRYTDEDSVELFGRATEPDSKFTFSASGDQMSLYANGTSYHFVRDAGELLSQNAGSISRSGRKLWNDGTWSPVSGGSVVRGRYSVTRTLQRREFWYSHEDPMLGRINHYLREGGASE